MKICFEIVQYSA